jgi:hypothetical protein
MNSPQFAGTRVSELVSRVAPAGRPEDEAVADLFLAILARRPTPSDWELVHHHRALAADSRDTANSEIAWMLLVSSEFSLNH